MLKIRENIKKAVVGKDEVIDLLLTCILAEGHVLIEDVPGTGKTLLAKSLSKSVEGSFGRIQFTPDLLPADVTGLNFYNRKEDAFVLKKGPVFCNILLADEINRATPRTQSALLECMEEKQVTVDKVTRKLEAPFFVIATQNPIETSGTFPLPEAQLDRFLMRISMGQFNEMEEIRMLKEKLEGVDISNVEAVCNAADIVTMQEEAKKVFVHDEILKYIVAISDATRNNDTIVAGVSPRGTIALVRACQALAYVRDRNFVTPEDVKKLAPHVLAHRLVLMEGFAGMKVYEDRIETILKTITVPTEDWSK